MYWRVVWQPRARVTLQLVMMSVICLHPMSQGAGQSQLAWPVTGWGGEYGPKKGIPFLHVIYVTWICKVNWIPTKYLDIFLTSYVYVCVCVCVYKDCTKRVCWAHTFWSLWRWKKWPPSACLIFFCKCPAALHQKRLQKYLKLNTSCILHFVPNNLSAKQCILNVARKGKKGIDKGQVFLKYE